MGISGCAKSCLPLCTQLCVPSKLQHWNGLANIGWVLTLHSLPPPIQFPLPPHSSMTFLGENPIATAQRSPLPPAHRDGASWAVRGQALWGLPFPLAGPVTAVLVRDGRRVESGSASTAWLCVMDTTVLTLLLVWCHGHRLSWGSTWAGRDLANSEEGKVVKLILSYSISPQCSFTRPPSDQCHPSQSPPSKGVHSRAGDH